MSTWLLTLTLLAAPQDPPATSPPQVAWQRTLDDALAVQQATGKPLLVCVNADGEPFCERFANDTYRDPAFVAMTQGWVCVVASPDRHTKSDYDGLGRRVECPRFPGCTCSEHIQIEPELFRRWFKNQRYAPRHVGIAKDGAILFDHFLDRDMRDAIDDVDKHKGKADAAAVPTDVAALLKRRDAASRRALEQRYQAADAAGRRTILQSARTASNEPLDLLRMGLRDDDTKVFAAAVAALCARPTPAGAIDLQDALARCEPAQEALLLAACDQLDAVDDATAQFFAHRRAAVAGVAKAAAGPFAALGEPAAEPVRDRADLEAALDAAEAAVRKAPKDAGVQLALAHANLEFAWFLLPAGDSTTPLWFEDARRAAERVTAMATASAPEQLAAAAIQAIVLREQGNDAAAQPFAATALAGIAKASRGFDARPRWVAALLGAAARSAANRAYDAVQKDPKAIPAEAVGDAAFAFAALAQHPWATDADVREGAALLAWAGARKAAQELLRRALPRFASSRDLHDEFRRRIAVDLGAGALHREYAAFLAAVTAQQGDLPTAQWFAGYAALVAAEMFVGDRQDAPAAAAYTECIEHMQASARGNAEFADSADHFAVLAHAGRALQRHLAGDAKGAVDDLLAAAALRPASMGEKDGLGRTPEAMLRRIARELREQGRTAEADRLPQD